MSQKICICTFFLIFTLLTPAQAHAPGGKQSQCSTKCSEQHSRLLTEGLSKRKAEDELVDATIMVGDKSFRVHKVVMSIFSPYFETRFKSEMRKGMEREDKFTLSSDNIDAGAFEMLKDYMYTSQITIDDSTVQRLLAGASYLQMTNVKAHCCSYMKERLDARNCLGIKYIADKYSCTDLLKSATALALDAFEEVVESAEFLELTKDQLIDIIPDDELTAPEVKIYEAVMRWIRYKDSSYGDRTAYLSTLMQHVRFSQMKPPYLVGVSKEPLIRDCKKCLKYVDEAKYHSLKIHLNGDRDDDESFLEARFKPRRTNYLFAVGGNIDYTYLECTSSVERYDPRINKWTEVVSLKSPRGWLGVAALNNILYAVGGYSSSTFMSSIECYNPHTDKWTDNVKPLEPARTTPDSVATLNGILYVIGGLYSRQSVLQSVEKYDPNTNEWIECEPLRQKKRGHAVGVLDGCIYVLGGIIDRQASNSVERYDPMENEWQDMSPMITKRYYFASVACKGYLYAVGGKENSSRILRSAEKYDSRKDRWEEIAPMTEKRYGYGLAVANGLLYAVGGRGSKSEYLDAVEVYDTATDTWSGRAPMLHRRSCFGLAAMKY